MSVYKRGRVYWYRFVFAGQCIRESTKFNNKTAALRAEAIRRAELAEGRAGIVTRKKCPLFEEFVTNDFLPWCKKEHEDHPTTYDRYVTAVRPLNQRLGQLRLDVISSGHAEKFKVTRAGE